MRTFDEFAEHWLSKLSEHVQTRICRSPRSEFPGDPVRSANLFVSALGYKPLTPFEHKGQIYGRWFNLAEVNRVYSGVNPADYAGHLADTLRHDMVHSSYEMLSDADARACAEGFYSYFAGGNVTRLANRLGNGWNSITKSTFEAAYIAMDDDWIGLFLLEAED